MKNTIFKIVLFLLSAPVFCQNSELPNPKMLQFSIMKRQYETLQRKSDPNQPDMVFKSTKIFWQNTYNDVFIDSLVQEIQLNAKLEIPKIATRPAFIQSTQTKFPENALLKLKFNAIEISDSAAAKLFKCENCSNFAKPTNAGIWIQHLNGAKLNVQKYNLKSEVELKLPTSFDFIEFSVTEIGKWKEFNDNRFQLVSVKHNSAIIKVEKKVDSLQVKALNNAGQAFITQNVQFMPCYYYDFFESDDAPEQSDIEKFVKKHQDVPQEPLYLIASASGKIATVILYIPTKTVSRKFKIEYVKE